MEDEKKEVENKPFKTMADVSALDAHTFFQTYRHYLKFGAGMNAVLDGFDYPDWFREVPAKDFYDYFKIFDSIVRDIPEPTWSDDWIDEEFVPTKEVVKKAVTELTAVERGKLYEQLTARGKQVFDMMSDNPTLTQEELADKFDPPISVKTLKIHLSKIRDTFKAEKTRDLFTVKT